MKDQTQQQEALRQAQLERLLAKHVGNDRLPVMTTFLHAFFELASSEALAARTPDALIELIKRHWELAQQRPPGDPIITLIPPKKSGQLAQLITITDDMPFLVDSISMAIRDAQTAIDWMVHPVLNVRRDDNGALCSIDGIYQGQGVAESFVHMEFEPLANQAEYDALGDSVTRVLSDLRQVVTDFPAMLQRLQQAADQISTASTDRNHEDSEEAKAFLAWLAQDNFTFLAVLRTEICPQSEPLTLITDEAMGLGLARAGECYANSDQFIAPQQEMARYVHSGPLVVITKAMERAHIHHPNYMDVVSVKRLNDDGDVIGTDRFIGLLSSDAYIKRPSDIPIIRLKVDAVLARSRLPVNSHSGKHLRDIIYQLPRDELFQCSQDELFKTCMGIRALRDRHRLRLFLRRDRYGRFYSCMVYLSRDHYSTQMREQVCDELMTLCNGQSYERSVDFLRDGLARIHCIVRISPDTHLTLTVEQAEQRLQHVTRSWGDQLRAILAEHKQVGMAAVRRYVDAFPLSYQHQVTPLDAATDLLYLLQLSEDAPFFVRLGVNDESRCATPNLVTLYSWDTPIVLSQVLPILENFSLQVARQSATVVSPKRGVNLWIHQFKVSLVGESPLSGVRQREYFEAALLAGWQGLAENDGLNRLVLLAGLRHRQVLCLRVITRYLIQTELPYSQHYMEQQLTEHAALAKLLVNLFEARFDPQNTAQRRQQQAIITAQAIDHALEQVQSLDADRILRAYLSVIRAALRSNFYQQDSDGNDKPYVSLKLDPSVVSELPKPLPHIETFVYGPNVEGIHLRGGLVARGGLRWSDRREDFRTEVLGLWKAQLVKNAIIVPVGAKGGFVLKGPEPEHPQQRQQLGRNAYVTFISGLLDITDNREGGTIIPPDGVVRHDGDDPYLVVAADKGTATFSDLANDTAARYNFWLGDAFASGGSAGYDHKKMGITARGAWESVKRHFIELGKDIQAEPFTVVGVGDMAGDVFGNGMLLSPHIRLVAAFNHQHIFIDPTPDTDASFAERQRLFNTPGSSWDDYDRQALSEGGGIWPRSAKRISLSAQAQQALGIHVSTLTPNELLRAILMAPVELLWNGGIGTYVKGSTESHADVGDRANDAIRINGRQLRARVVGEGGNLGLTQRGRVEFALEGGRINSDAIDNSGGVHSSDREVNIKIVLNRRMAAGDLSRDDRDTLLESMTAELASAVLSDNQIQSLAISLLFYQSRERLQEHLHHMRLLEREGRLDRHVEDLPDDDGLAERRAKGLGLTRPELGVLLSYSKNALFEALLDSPVLDDPLFDDTVLRYFPSAMASQCRQALLEHDLRRELIATVIANRIVNRLGFAHAHRYADEHGVPLWLAAKGFCLADAVCSGETYWGAVDKLSGVVSSDVQFRLYGRITGLLKHISAWMITRGHGEPPLGETIDHYREGIRRCEALLPQCLGNSYRQEWQQAVEGMMGDGVPQAIAQTMANTMVLGSAMDIVDLANVLSVELDVAAEAYYLVGDRFNVLWLLSRILALPVAGRWQALARANLREDTYRLQRQITARVLAFPGDNAAARFEGWQTQHAHTVNFAMDRIERLQTDTGDDFMTLAVGVRALRTLRRL